MAGRACLRAPQRLRGDGARRYNLIVILLSVSMAWSMVWGCFAYLVSANMKGWRGISIFVICYVFVSVVNQLLIAYSK